MKKNISENLQLAVESEKQQDRRTVYYMYGIAFTKCDCGGNLLLAETVYGSSVYHGKCSCGLKFKLTNNKLLAQ